MTWQKQRDVQLIADAQSGEYTLEDILEQYQLKESEIAVICESHHITPVYAKKRRKKEKKKEKIIRPEQRQQRDENLLSDARTGFYNLNQLSEKYDLTKQRIHQILKRWGYAIKELQQQKKQGDEEKRVVYQQLGTVLIQYYFNRLIQEKGENQALAWRCQDFYKCGKNYSLEQLTKLIGARRNGEGYYKSIKYAGLATKKEEIMQKIPYVKYVLTKALHGVI